MEAYFTVDGDEDQAVVVRAKLLVGADGMHSVIRKQMIGDDARYLSLVDWNCVILNPDLRWIPASCDPFSIYDLPVVTIHKAG